MQFADANSVRTKLFERLTRMFVLDCEMTAVVIDPEAIIDSLVLCSIRSQRFEKPDGFCARFQVTKRFRLEAKVQRLPGTLSHLRDMFYCSPDIRAHLRDLFLRRDQGLERSWHSAHTSLHARRHQRCQEIEQAIRIF